MAPPLNRRTFVVVVLLAVTVAAASCSSSPSTRSAGTTTTPKSTSTIPPPPPNVSDDTTAGPVGTLQGGAFAVPAPAGQTLAIPATIPANCSQDVSGPLKKWLNRLPANSTVLVSVQACYRVDKGLRLKNPTGLTIYGGTFTSDATTPGKKKTAKEQYVFDLVGGSNVTLESMKINGQNPGGYHANMAFAGAIDVEGTSGITIMGVTITNPFGDGISLSPLRGGADNDSGTIVGPTKNAVIQGVSISGAGRQAVTMASASGVQVSDLVVLNPGINTFDIEADQHNEGADNVTIDGCTSSGGEIFFANGGSGSSDKTHDFTIAHCAMAKTTAGEAILSIANGPSRKHQRGPFNFVADVLYCGNSADVACVQLSGAEATVEDSVLHFPRSAPHEPVYHVVKNAVAVFTNDRVHGYGIAGHVGATATVKVTSGHWVLASGAGNGTGAGNKQGRHQNHQPSGP